MSVRRIGVSFPGSSPTGGSKVTTHHNASIEVVPEDGRRSRLIWITDVLPDELRDRIAGLMQKGSLVAKATLERDLAGRNRR